MARADNATIYRKDYQAPFYKIMRCHLDVQIYDDKAVITSKMTIKATGEARKLVLQGEHLTLEQVHLDGQLLAPSSYDYKDGELVIEGLPEACEIAVTSHCDPYTNTALEGLYNSQGMLCTQCEPEGFRRICFYQDRPDILAPFTVRIEADKSLPHLLSNGNLIETGEAEEGRHFALWEDPHPKPSYLFALVAGDLELVEDSFVTASGRKVDLHIYVEHGNGHLTDHAMDSLKRSMKWDEDVYGLEYDLDLFQIVAVSHFNMGAMENKGLNIFNSKFVLADKATATDDDLDRVEAIIAHEYFHNWTGNRVTCRDWFQLTLKEGLTVYRDQRFSADMHDEGVKRASDVATLRAIQFPEDASPTAHPIRPESFVEINNFYTPTVYEKGAEIIRMMASQLGLAGFRRGMDLYFERHDGQAVTCDDFINAMADANDADLSLMQRWYSQAGTPRLEIARTGHDAQLQLKLSQSTPETKANTPRLPVPMPVRLGFIDKDGKPASFALDNGASATEQLILFNAAEADYNLHFDKPETAPFTPSYLRDFSAPVKCADDLSDEERLHLMAYDSDAFNRWEQAQKLLEKAIHQQLHNGFDGAFLDALASAYQVILTNDNLRGDYKAYMMAMPGQSVIEASIKACDPVAIFAAREALRAELAHILSPMLNDMLVPSACQARRETAADRHFQNSLLRWAVAGRLDGADDQALIQSQDELMSLSQGALMALNMVESPARQTALQAFHDKWQNDSLVMEKWFSLQASAPYEGTIKAVSSLMAHPAFDAGNPNKLRSVLGSFAAANPTQFHKEDGSGYAFMAEQLALLDERNPQIAARMALGLTRISSYDEPRQERMLTALRQLNDKAQSRDLKEVVGKALAQ